MHRNPSIYSIASVCLVGTVALAGCAKPNSSGVPANIAVLQLNAARGNAVAANNLGVAYANGTGIPQDFSEAKKWFLFASDHGNPAGEYNLAAAYQQGQGTPVDLPEALKWYELAVSHNYAPAKLALGLMYRTGVGVPRNENEAGRLIRASAVEGFPPGQAVLAGLYLEGGGGVEADDGLAYEWASLAASKLTGVGGALAKSERDNAEKGMTPADLAVAQAATAQWKPGADLVSPFQPNSGPRPARIRGQGSGFVIGKNGDIATAFHVVRNCREVRLKDSTGKYNGVSHVVGEDRDNDMAVLAGAGFGTRLKIAGNDPTLGETIVTYGFPLGPMLSSNGNMTTGSVSASTGMQGDAKTFQITAPVQAGSSGGPVVDETGAVVGVVTSTLNAVALAAATGNLAQNVNFAMRTAPLRTLLERQGVAFDSSGKAPARSTSELVDALQKATVKIECWR